MGIRRVDSTHSRDTRRFTQFPFYLYRNSSLWVPPLATEARGQLDPQSHPFCEHSEAAFFLAMERKEVVGRSSELDNVRYNEYYDERTAFFYHLTRWMTRWFLERSLARPANGRASGQLELLWGPKGLLAGEGQGVLVAGFSHRPAMGVRCNHPYCSALVEDAGFERKLDFVSCYADREYAFPVRFLEIAEKIKRRRGLSSQHFQTKSELRALIPRVTSVYNQTFTEVQGYVPVTDAEARVIGQRIISISAPNLISLLTKGDELVGFVLAYPDISAALQRCRGSVWPTDWYHLTRECGRTRWINFGGVGILDEYRGLGGNAMLCAQLYYILIDLPQYDYADLVQVQEPNQRMMKELKAMGVNPWKRHRTYRITLT